MHTRELRVPTVLLIDGYRFFFFSNENREPPHVHIEKGDSVAKWWLIPLREEWTSGFSPAQRRRIHTIIVENEATILEQWNEHFETGE